MHNEPLDNMIPLDIEPLPPMDFAGIELPETPAPAELERLVPARSVQPTDALDEITLTIDDNALVIATHQHVSTIRWLPYSDIRTFRIQPYPASGAGCLPTRFLVVTEGYGEKPSPIAWLDSQEKAETVIKMIHAAIDGHVASKNVRQGLDALPTVESSREKPSPFVRALAAAGMIVLGIGIVSLLAFLIPYMHHLAARY